MSTCGFSYVLPFTVYTASHAVPPLSAVDDRGNDVLAAVMDLDGIPAPTVGSPATSYTFDFGAVAHPENAKLLIDGWAVYGLKGWTPKTQPYVQVVDGGGNWVTVGKFGFIAGDEKTMVWDIPNPFLSADQRLRVFTGGTPTAAFVIDRVRLDDSAPVAVQATPLAPSSADLHHRGALDYVRASITNRTTATDSVLPDLTWAYGYGAFTRYGDVLPLLTDSDDMYVVMRHADELTLSFVDAPAAPGMERTYLLYVDLWYRALLIDKLVTPLPYHGMTAYPYTAPESYPSDQAHQDYLTNYDTRVCTP
jgi:hypothetical protein